MKRSPIVVGTVLIVLILLTIIIGGIMVKNQGRQDISADQHQGVLIALPKPAKDGQVSVEQALWQRRSVRDFSDKPLSLDQVAQLLWAAQGITDSAGHRTAPSAGALYPLEVYLVAGAVEGLEAGVYHYLPESHELLFTTGGDLRTDVADAALGQHWMADAPAMIVIAAIYARTNVKYGERTQRYVNMEVGAAAQNVYLQVEALDLSTVFVGAFYEMRVQNVLELEEVVIPLGIMPVGK